ncbi:MAG TPA: hypothetical protein VLK27_00495 [Chthoniobacterales bacterium]|nr:hypothetical protein [Chthoniobacterales bacterium]
MKLLLMAVAGFAPALGAQADDLPTKVNFERYKAMLEHSPFAVASAVVAPAATPNFARDLYLANAARSPDGDMVTIASSGDKDFKKYLTTKTPMDGYAIVSIEWSDKIGETKVTISKDGQLATLNFNQAVLVQPLPKQPVYAPPIRPQPVFQRPAGLQTPPPDVRGVIQRNPQGQTPPPSGEE